MTTVLNPEGRGVELKYLILNSFLYLAFGPAGGRQRPALGAMSVFS